jgi:hypothetical protein
MITRFRQFATLGTVALFLLTASCKGKNDSKQENTTVQEEVDQEQGQEYTAAYVCPMHCEGSGSDQEGNCPKCGMAYVANEAHTKDGHTH